LKKRKRVTLGIAVLALAAAVGGLVASTAIKSPAQVAAETKSPGATLLTAPVQRGVVSQTVLAQGVAAEPSQISGPPVFGGGGTPAGSGAGAPQPIVTRIFLPAGSTVHVAQPIVEVAGRPVFAMPGSVPAYRNLAPGESGTDVTQLQEGLGAAGHPIGSDTRGTFGEGTEAAVASFYAAIGYSTPEVTTGPKADRGPMVPLDEILFVPRLPAHVAKIDAQVGELAQGSLVTLAVGNPVIDGQIPASSAGLVRVGMKLSITNDLTGLSDRGTLVSISHLTSTSGSIGGGPYVRARIRPSRPLQVSLIGQDVQITITTACSDGPVLTVPEAAVFAEPNGSTYVTTVSATGDQARVRVRVGVTGNGLVQVTPLGGGLLSAGNRVVTGENYAGSGAGNGPGTPSSGPGESGVG
jgi:hypothetical protein